MKARAINVVLLLCLGFLWSLRLHAQGKITGSVVVSESSSALFSASVTLYDLANNFKGAAITDTLGTYSFTNVPFGYYKVKASFIGFKSHTRDSILVSEKKKEIFLKPIRLKQDTSDLKSVEIVAEKSDFGSDIGKKVYQINENIGAEGRSALDVLRNLPSVNVAVNGRITLRGSRSVNVLIDGKQSGLSGSTRRAILDNLPAAAIEKIEVITNPDAQYDAQGTAGIINVVLKKGGMLGSTGSLSLSAATVNKYNVNGYFAYYTPKVTFFSSYAYRYYTTFNFGYSDKNVFSTQPDFYFLQKRRGVNLQGTHTGRSGLTYYPGKSNSISATGVIRYQEESQRNRFEQSKLFSDRAPDSSSMRNGFNLGKSLSYDADLSFEQRFKNKNHKLLLEASYSGNADNNATDLKTLYYDSSNTLLNLEPSWRNISRKSIFKLIIGRADYHLPIMKKMSFDAGAKFGYRSTDNDFLGEDYDYNTLQWKTNSRLTNHFIYKERILAGYVTFSHGIKKFAYKVGLRLEHTAIQTQQITTAQNNSNQYLAPFPSLRLVYKPRSHSEISLSYSRRIDRPDINQLNPFPNVSNPLTVISGNPLLKPEYAHSLEWSYDYTRDKNSFIGSVYYKFTENLQSRFSNLADNGVTYITYQNLSNSHSGGIELSSRNEIFKWWKMNSSANVFYYRINANNLQSQLVRSSVGASFKLMPTFTFFKNLELQLSGNFYIPQASAQTRTLLYGYMDIALRKTFFNKRLSIIATCSDVFNTNIQRTITTGASFKTISYRKYESRIFQLTLTYRFGKISNTKMLKEEEETRDVMNQQGED